MSKKVDLTGERFGELLVVKEAGTLPGGIVLYECLCSCGKTTIVRGNNLKSGNTRSCGHLFKKNVKEMHITHGGCNERLHGVWNAIKGRCYNPKCKAYKNYGAKGIRMYEEWRNDYVAFREFFTNLGYNKNSERGELTIERIDVNGNYEPSNCTLIPLEKQMRNKTNSHFISYQGETKTVTEFAIEYDIQVDTLLERLKAGWSVEYSLLKPVKECNRKVPMHEVNGESHSIREWAQILGMNKGQLKYRLKKKTLEEIVREIRG